MKAKKTLTQSEVKALKMEVAALRKRLKQDETLPGDRYWVISENLADAMDDAAAKDPRGNPHCDDCYYDHSRNKWILY